jgi:ribosome-associated toxin RatA of RatAB toxin-antitoxin module
MLKRHFLLLGAQVWRVLTDYEALPTFVPNLDYCERLPSRSPGKLILRQVACSQGALWRLEAEAVLEVEEVHGPMGRREVRFTAIKGDFQQFSGRWVIEPDASSSAGRATVLRYDISVQPRIPMPSAVVSYVVRAGLPANVKAVVQRAEQQANKRLQASGLASWAGVEEDVPLPARWEDEAADAEAASTTMESEVASRPAGFYEVAGPLPSKGPFWPRGSLYAAAAPLTADRQRRRAAKEAARSTYLGTASVPLPPAGTPDSSVQRALDEKLREKQQLQTMYPAFGLRRSGEGVKTASSSENAVAAASTTTTTAAAAANNNSNFNGSSNTADNAVAGTGAINSSFTTLDPSVAVDINNSTATQAPPPAMPMTLPAEVHLRRLDGLDFLHRRAVAAVSVDAPASLVWEVLTDYDHLADFIPNLAASERIKLPPSAPANVVRVRQVGYKRMMYMCLHAESVLDLIEKPCNEIQFRQVAGDFERFQGKWMLSEGAADPELAGAGYSGPQTQLKYAMEIIIPHTGRMLGVIEPVLERVVFEDAPANLAAIKRRVEALALERKAAALEEAGEASRAATLRRRSARPRLSDMVDDFTVLCAELERCFGDKKLLPTREAMRDMNR